MTQARNNVSAGFSAQQAQAISGVPAGSGTPLVAAGTTQGTALPLPGDVNFFGTVAASSGTLLNPMNPSDSVIIYNKGANALSVYPPVGASINSLAVNAPYVVATATPYCEVYCINAGQYIASQSA